MESCSHVSFFYLLGLILKFQFWTRGVLYFLFSYPFILNFSTCFYLVCVHMQICRGSRGEVRCPPHLAPCLLSFTTAHVRRAGPPTSGFSCVCFPSHYRSSGTVAELSQMGCVDSNLVCSPAWQAF